MMLLHQAPVTLSNRFKTGAFVKAQCVKSLCPLFVGFQTPVEALQHPPDLGRVGRVEILKIEVVLPQGISLDQTGGLQIIRLVGPKSNFQTENGQFIPLLFMKDIPQTVQYMKQKEVRLKQTQIFIEPLRTETEKTLLSKGLQQLVFAQSVGACLQYFYYRLIQLLWGMFFEYRHIFKGEE